MSNIIATWEIKIIAMIEESMYIGISSHQDIEDGFVFNKEPNYGYRPNASIMSGHNGGRYGKGAEVNDIIKIEYNAGKQTLTYYKNNKSMGVAYRNIVKGKNIKYKLAVYMYWKNNAVSILNYSEYILSN